MSYLAKLYRESGASETSSAILPYSLPLLHKPNLSCYRITRNRHVSMNPLAAKNRKHPKNLQQNQILLWHKTISKTDLHILHQLHFGLVFVHLTNTSVKVEAHKDPGFQQNKMQLSFAIECLKEFSQIYRSQRGPRFVSISTNIDLMVYFHRTYWNVGQNNQLRQIFPNPCWHFPEESIIFKVYECQ